MSNGSYTVMLHKQGKASILALATLFKIALPRKFRDLFSPSYNYMNHPLHLQKALFHLQNTSMYITSLESHNIPGLTLISVCILETRLLGLRGTEQGSEPSNGARTSCVPVRLIRSEPVSVPAKSDGSEGNLKSLL